MIISKSEAIRQLCQAGIFASYADARTAGAHDALSVPSVAYNMTTAERVATVYGITIGTPARLERCRVYLMPGMRCDSNAGHSGLHTNEEE